MRSLVAGVRWMGGGAAQSAIPVPDAEFGNGLALRSRSPGSRSKNTNDEGVCWDRASRAMRLAEAQLQQVEVEFVVPTMTISPSRTQREAPSVTDRAVPK